jgi:hypothetical protein
VQVEPTSRERVLLKPILHHVEGRPRRFPPNNEQVGRVMAIPSQVLVVWAIPR